MLGDSLSFVDMGWGYSSKHDWLLKVRKSIKRTTDGSQCLMGLSPCVGLVCACVCMWGGGGIVARVKPL